MPRFSDEHTRILRKAMLDTRPVFLFSQENVETLVVETGLSRAQIHKWAELFRYRWLSKPEDDIQAHLRSNKQVRDPSKTGIVKVDDSR
jgi:hypothetical protein